MSETTLTAPRRSNLVPLLAIWTVVLVVGFAIVLLVGRPLPSAAEELSAAYAPAAPVTEATALQSAETIVRLEHPDLLTGERTVERRSDFGSDRWVVVYNSTTGLTGVRISITVDTGKVSVATFP